MLGGKLRDFDFRSSTEERKSRQSSRIKIPRRLLDREGEKERDSWRGRKRQGGKRRGGEARGYRHSIREELSLKVEY